uniref:Uncharacterized protein n=1 Tax=Anguilla anguilla TaxID=7936 RepID=A0A0E9V7E9_ANGAN
MVYRELHNVWDKGIFFPDLSVYSTILDYICPEMGAYV